MLKSNMQPYACSRSPCFRRAAPTTAAIPIPAVRCAALKRYSTARWFPCSLLRLRKIGPPSVGTVGGGVVGGVLGNMVGGGRGKTLATIAGAALGAAGGYAGEKALTKQNGLEITVELENGQQLSIVQAADQQFSPGERVRELRGSDARRV